MVALGGRFGSSIVTRPAAWQQHGRGEETPLCIACGSVWVDLRPPQMPSFPLKAGLLLILTALRAVRVGRSERRSSFACFGPSGVALLTTPVKPAVLLVGIRLGRRGRACVCREPRVSVIESLFYARTRPRVFDTALAYSSEGASACFIIIVMPSRLAVRV